jgi:hypothetical protein
MNYDVAWYFGACSNSRCDEETSTESKTKKDPSGATKKSGSSVRSIPNSEAVR